jgi:hypothetical protein
MERAVSALLEELAQERERERTLDRLDARADGLEQQWPSPPGNKPRSQTPAKKMGFSSTTSTGRLPNQAISRRALSPAPTSDRLRRLSSPNPRKMAGHRGAAIGARSGSPSPAAGSRQRGSRSRSPAPVRRHQPTDVGFGTAVTERKQLSARGVSRGRSASHRRPPAEENSVVVERLSNPNLFTGVHRHRRSADGEMPAATDLSDVVRRRSMSPSPAAASRRAGRAVSAGGKRKVTSRRGTTPTKTRGTVFEKLVRFSFSSPLLPPLLLQPRALSDALIHFADGPSHVYWAPQAPLRLGYR